MGKNKEKPHRKHKIAFPDLGQILDFFTVKAIMTPREKFFYCQPYQNASEAKMLLINNRFSGAPLKDETIRRYVRLEKLEEFAENIKYCVEVATEISEKERIQSDTTIGELTTVFAEKNCRELLFVTDDNSIVGLVTGADLDKIAVKVYFFILISALESHLLDIIGKDYKTYRCCLQNPANVKKRYEKCEGELVGLEEYNYLVTSEILEIVWKSEIKTILRVETREELEDLKDFRNLIAHGNYIITEDDDIGRLKKMNGKIRSYIMALERP